MTITNGTFDTDLNGWTSSGSDNYDVRWENSGPTPGRAMLRIYRCSRANLSQTFVIDDTSLSFDWETYAEQWWEQAAWKLTVGDVTIIDEGLSMRDHGGYSGTRTVDVSPYIGQTATIEFRMVPSSFCGNPDHANTYLRIDNVKLFNPCISIPRCNLIAT